MKRIIIDYKKLTQEMAAALLQHYPQGYGDEEINSFKNAKGERVKAVELPAGDVLYLVKISQNLSYLMSHFDEFGEETTESRPATLENEYDGSLETDLALED